VHEKQQLAVGLARQTGAEAPPVAERLVLLTHVGLDLAPVHPEGRVGDAVVEALALVAMLVVGERVAQLDARVVALDEHVGQADGVRLAVELLAIEVDDRVGV